MENKDVEDLTVGEAATLDIAAEELSFIPSDRVIDSGATAVVADLVARGWDRENALNVVSTVLVEAGAPVDVGLLSEAYLRVEMQAEAA
jgi:hypothetical protein